MNSSDRILRRIAMGLAVAVVLLMLVAMVYCLVVPFLSKMLVGSLGASTAVLMGLSVAVMVAAACVTGYYFYRFIQDVVEFILPADVKQAKVQKDNSIYKKIKTNQKVINIRSFELVSDEAPGSDPQLEVVPGRDGSGELVSFDAALGMDEHAVLPEDYEEPPFYHFRQTRARIRQSLQSMSPRLKQWWQRRRFMAGYVADEQNHDQWGWLSVENQQRHEKASTRRGYHALWLLGLGVLIVTLLLVVPMASLPVTAGTAGLLLTQHFHWLVMAMGLAGLWAVAMVGHQRIDRMKPIHQPKSKFQAEYTDSVQKSKRIHERHARIAMVLLGIGIVLLCALAPPLAVPILSGTVGYFLEATAIWVQLSAVILLTALAMQVFYTAVVRPLISAWVRAEHRALNHPGAVEALGDQNPIVLQPDNRIQYVKDQQDPYLLPRACVKDVDEGASVNSICDQMIGNHASVV